MTAGSLRIGLAQIGSVAGDIGANLTRHLAVIEQAAIAEVSLLVFPELSLTGYEPSLVTDLALAPDDPRLRPLIDAAGRHAMHVVAGLPLAAGHRPLVGALIILPDGDVTSYAKMHLHPGEEASFGSGDRHHLLDLAGERIAFAICADTNAPEHAEQCAALGATVYLAGVLITEGGYTSDTTQLALTAERHKMLVGMANHNAISGGMVAIGRSGFWTADGLLAVANGSDTLVVAERSMEGKSWASRTVALSLI